ncbi:cupin domain-containing protein [Bosea sp. F3-2]|uniref:cupin domain-containing protein n=1 Tax=Bosea sp. F3-2 TaxID=2599640 RepID=UPI0011EF8955|nr:cupin domain-containing protein [Bosea sp. F3-2]QEL24750.1 cupin domain-containing protein [Bosea sp. F3-2]
MKRFTHPAVSPSDDGTVAIAFGKHIVRVLAEDTGGSCGMLEAIVPAGEGPPLHVHEREDEFFRILTGRFGFWCTGEYVELGEGGCIVLPRGIPHCFRNIGREEGRLMVLVTPGGFESFFPTVERCEPVKPAQISSVARDFGLSFLLDENCKVA